MKTFLASILLALVAAALADRVLSKYDKKQELTDQQIREDPEVNGDLQVFNQSIRRTKRHQPRLKFYDAESFTNWVQKWVSENVKSGDRSGFVRRLVNEASIQAKPGYNVLVYNLNQDYSERLIDSIAYTTVSAYAQQFGVWLLKCGYVHNNGGMRGSDSWAYSGDHVSEGSGKGAYLLDRDCPQKAYRPFNAYVVINKDPKPGANLKSFGEIGSIEECALKIREIGGQAGAYVPEWRNCHAQRMDGGAAGLKMHANDDSYLGAFNIVGQDKEETSSLDVRRRWIDRRECDVIYTEYSPWHSWCKQLPECWSSVNKGVQCLGLFLRGD